MKKIIAILLAAVMLFSFCACDDVVEGFKEGYEEGLQEAADEASKDIKRGVVDGQVYTSEYLGVTFTAPETWVYKTDEELKALLNDSLEDFDYNYFSETVTKVANIYDMMVTDSVTGSSVSVMYENVKLTNGSRVSEDTYIKVLEEGLAEQKMTVEQVEKNSITLDGQNYTRVAYNAKLQDVPMELCYYVKSQGDFIILVIIMTANGVTLADAEAMFG